MRLLTKTKEDYIKKQGIELFKAYTDKTVNGYSDFTRIFSDLFDILLGPENCVKMLHEIRIYMEKTLNELKENNDDYC